MKNESTGPLLAEANYWDIVRESLLNAVDQESQLAKLTSILTEMKPNQILTFALRTEELLYRAHTTPLKCACWIMNYGYGSEDGFIYFKTWLISKGQKIYSEALENPDSLIPHKNPNNEFYESEQFRYAPHYAFEQTSGEDLYYYYPKNFAYTEGKYPNLEIPKDKPYMEFAKTTCPGLYDAFKKRNRFAITPKQTSRARKK